MYSVKLQRTSGRGCNVNVLVVDHSPLIDPAMKNVLPKYMRVVRNFGRSCEGYTPRSRRYKLVKQAKAYIQELTNAQSNAHGKVCQIARV